jgi:hypothetical protein
MNESTTLYERKVAGFAAKHSMDTFSNDGEVRAAIVISYLLANAKSTYRGYTTSFRDDFYSQDRILNQLRLFLSKEGASLKILSKTMPIGSVLNQLAVEFKGKVELKVGEDLKDFDFCVIDEEAYREEHDQQTTSASVCFNDPVTAQSLSAKFDKLFFNAKQVNLDSTSSSASKA